MHEPDPCRILARGAGRMRKLLAVFCAGDGVYAWHACSCRTSPEDRQDRPPAIRVLLSSRHRQSGHTACTLPVINRLHLRRSGQPRAECCRTSFSGNSMSACNVVVLSMVSCGCAVIAVMLNTWSPSVALAVGAIGECRGFCPSCGARRMVESAALLVDEVLPHEPMRQWVLCVPCPLGFLFASQPKMMGKALSIVYRT